MALYQASSSGGVKTYVKGTSVDLSSYKSGNPYTTKKNGYVRATGLVGSNTYVYINDWPVGLPDNKTAAVVWVRKGMTLYTSSTAPDNVYFYPDDSE